MVVVRSNHYSEFVATRSYQAVLMMQEIIKNLIKLTLYTL